MWLVTRIQGEKPEKALAREGEAELSARVCVCDLLHGKRELSTGKEPTGRESAKCGSVRGFAFFTRP